MLKHFVYISSSSAIENNLGSGPSSGLGSLRLGLLRRAFWVCFFHPSVTNPGGGLSISETWLIESSSSESISSVTAFA